ncbi:hypothetical protein GCM10010171_57480 [Actinokineospora fastidiosa]|uniref:Uncharacterized protein n=1 Tax=Actinokineospora fastidiosa TaxID=1816 RepID=A0A918LJ17_9PSEU|nr:hypothetical protein GCM10010171_57480 [Actinokineospora fastidiosa]
MGGCYSLVVDNWGGEWSRVRGSGGGGTSTGGGSGGSVKTGSFTVTVVLCPRTRRRLGVLGCLSGWVVIRTPVINER